MKPRIKLLFNELSKLIVRTILLGLTVYCIPSFGQEINQKKLEQLVLKAEASHTDGLVIYHNKKLVGEWYFAREQTLVDVKSVTKSITNLAIGYLVSQGKLRIDQKVSEFYPEWRQENKEEITIKHLLSHTSGLLDSDFNLIESAPNIIKFALASDLTHPVGKFYIYNNKAVNLLAGIVEKVDGRKLDGLVHEEIFTPLGIEKFVWPKDQEGNPYVMAFLQLYPNDLAKIGLLALNKGAWDGNQIINQSWFDKSTDQKVSSIADYGLLWELLPENLRYVVDGLQVQKMESNGFSPELINKAKKMLGSYESYGEYNQKLQEIFTSNEIGLLNRDLTFYGFSMFRKESGRVRGFAGIGYLGQYLVVYPELGLVAVRLINNFEGYNWDSDEFTDFPKLVLELVEPDN